MMTFRSFLRQATFTALISSSSASHFLILDPAEVDDHVHLVRAVFDRVRRLKALGLVVSYPFGKPMTVQMGSLSPTYSFACFTYDAGMQTLAVWYFIPSSQIALISAHVAVWLNSVVAFT